MAAFVAFNRNRAFLLPPDLKAWLPEDDLAHFVAAAERVPLGSFAVAARAGGKPQHHPHLMPALPMHGHADVMPTPSSCRGGHLLVAADRAVAASRCASPPPTCLPITTSPRNSRRPSCGCRCWRVRSGCCGWARCRSTAPGSMPTPARWARCDTTASANGAPSARRGRNRPPGLCSQTGGLRRREGPPRPVPCEEYPSSSIDSRSELPPDP